MITYGIWEDFEFKVNYKKGQYYNYAYEYEDNYVAWLLLGTIAFTLISLVLDLLFSPIEIIYLICRKVVKKIRREKR